MKLHTIASIEDTRLDPYRHLRTTNLTRFSGRFIAESRPLVQRLLASDLQVESILVDQKRLEEGLVWLPDHIPIFVVEHEAVAELIGFQFHRGFLACGIRPETPAWEPMRMPDHWTGVMFVGVSRPRESWGNSQDLFGAGDSRCFYGAGVCGSICEASLASIDGECVQVAFL